MEKRMKMMEQRMEKIEKRFSGSEGDYDKNQAGNTTEPNEMEAHQPKTDKKKKLGMYVAMMKNSNMKKGKSDAESGTSY